MKNYWYFFTLAFILLSTASCRKLVDLKVTDSEPKLVIEANYDAVKEEVYVNITKTINVFSPDTFPIITGALVEIINENGVISVLNDNGDGTYKLENYAPIYSSTYRMRVTVEGEVYEAEDFLTPFVTIDSLTYQYTPQTFFSGAGYLVFMHGVDPIGERNYYRLVKQINGEYKRKLGDQLLFDDEMNDGDTLHLTLFGEIFELSDTVAIELISYSEQSYKYVSQWLETAGSGAFNSAPANPKNNWSVECLGNFTVFGYARDSVIIGE